MLSWAKTSEEYFNLEVALGFSVLRFWLFLDRFFGLAVNFGLRILRVLAFGFWFSSNTNRSVGIFFPVCLRSERLNWSDAVQC